MTDQPQPADWVGWRQLLKLGEQLMAASSVAAQVELILETAARLLRGQCDLWLADVFYRLPCSEELPTFSALPPSELMRSAVESRRVTPSDTVDAETRPLIVVAPLMVNDALLGRLS